jgi:cytochrome c
MPRQTVPNQTSLFLFICFLTFISSASFLSCKQQQASNADNNEPPEENRFTKVVLTEGMDEPMEMSFTPDGHVLIVERKGGLKSFDLKTNQMKLVATIPVNTKYTNKEGVVSEAEEGLMGIVVHPKFGENHWIYLYYADPVEKKHVLARWELHGDSLYAATKKIILEVPTQREVCCHTGGGMVFDAEGNLYLTVGNNTANPISGTSDLDERVGRESWDDQRSAGNTNDLRGKILRIHPENDGSYTIPDGNLFPKGTAKTRPEIYVMGDRNPWRISIDSKTGYIYWGEVGPDALEDTKFGARGYDELNQARKAGFFGWPYFIGDNIPYTQYNYVDTVFGPKFDPSHPVNNSRNNTGIRDLPPAQKALIWYPYAQSDTFKLVGSSGRSATGGPIFRKADFKNAARPFPDYYEGKWLATDFMRGWIMAISMDEQGNYKSMERFMPKENFSSALDMKFGPEGDLYVLEYGSSWFRGNDNSALIRIEYNAGNRKPAVAATADRTAGAVPFTVNLSSKGTVDYDKYDKDALKYEWKITAGRDIIKTFAQPDGSVTLDKPGNYTATLTVTDTKGESNSKSVELKAGNDPPQVAVNITKGNKTFFFPNEPLAYTIAVNDKEDGSIADGKIKPDLVAVNFDYVPEGFDPIEIAQNHRAADEKTGFSAGLYLINSNDCKSCHMIAKTSVGPAYNDVSEKYKNDPTALSNLSAKVIHGGGGVWGQHAMAAHPKLSQHQAETMVKYILGLSQKQAATTSIPFSGTYITKVPAGENGKGGYLLRAAYTDKGTNAISGLSTENIIALRNPSVNPQLADEKKGAQLITTPVVAFYMTGNNSYLGYNNIDLSGIKEIQFTVQAQPRSGAVGGIIEVHLDKPDGKLIAKTDTVVSKDFDFRKFMGDQNAKPKDKPGAKASAPKAPPKIDFDAIMKMMNVQASAAIEPTEGFHNIYFVFKNDKGGDDKVIMQAVQINFLNRAATKK